MKDLFLGLLAIYSALSFFPFIFGLMAGSYKNGDCFEPMERIEYVVPAFRVGCWLGGVPGESK